MEIRARVCCVRVRNAAKNNAPTTGWRGVRKGEGGVEKNKNEDRTRRTSARARVGAHQVRCSTAFRAPGLLFHHARGWRRRHVVCVRNTP